jgi:gas vesicle protein
MARTDGQGPGAGSVLLAFAAGVVIGGAVALLMAPKSGSETRRIIADRARQGQDKAEELARRGREVWAQQKEDIVEAVQRGVESFRNARESERA